jgi:hypothetical protein
MTSFVGAAGLKPTALPPAGGMRYNHSLFIFLIKRHKKRPSYRTPSFVKSAGLKPTALPPSGGMRCNHSLFISSSTDIKKGHPFG